MTGEGSGVGIKSWAKRRGHDRSITYFYIHTEKAVPFSKIYFSNNLLSPTPGSHCESDQTSALCCHEPARWIGQIKSGQNGVAFWDLAWKSQTLEGGADAPSPSRSIRRSHGDPTGSDVKTKKRGRNGSAPTLNLFRMELRTQVWVDTD
ncbi:hypothetical protein CVT26_004771 [Gymnopilus dilepis]|uniref:Uncharacterized protein n=1 Tax=Gymnopilus dilepis TaxID=231916 RepID=A0A409XZF8_9AGAR|nr:hypothetical protein CVT26_004771 [Gymnopilus dilepis]